MFGSAKLLCDGLEDHIGDAHLKRFKGVFIKISMVVFQEYG